MKKILTTALVVLACIVHIEADTQYKKRADFHAPINIMGDHTHSKKEIMTSYRFMSMFMHGNREGQSQKTVSDIHNAGFMKAPVDMTMNMHMLGVMYAPSNSLTLMSMIHVKKNTMNIDKKMMGKITRESKSTSGFGDIGISALYDIKNTKHYSIIGKAGLSLPVGSINEKDGGTTRLPYAMQLGSGTLDIPLSITYTRFYATFSSGVQANSILRTGRNAHRYRLGNHYNITAWIAKNLRKNLSLSARIHASISDDIEGSDSDINTMIAMSPTASTNTGRKTTDCSVGFNYIFKTGTRIASELTIPLIRQVDGYQLETDWQSTLGVQHAF
ncbi:alpha amylase [Candidatus Marinamargulisbacteria bacterium SCGC AG-343-D04]|nr:alpha amylase [Candidatus Marinamargulisbacteria bacterium SCGC AG-343-D04]